MSAIGIRLDEHDHVILAEGPATSAELDLTTFFTSPRIGRLGFHGRLVLTERPLMRPSADDTSPPVKG